MALFRHSILRDGELPVLRPDFAEHPVVFVIADHHTGHRSLTDRRAVDHKRLPRVQRVQIERSAVFFPGHLVGQDQSLRHAADVHPVHDFLVVAFLVLRPHELIELGDLFADRVLSVISVADILNRLIQQVCRLEGHNLIGPVHRDLVVDVLPDVFFLAPDVLLPAVEVPQVADFPGVDQLL